MTAKLQDRGQGHPEKEYGQYADKIEEQWRLQCLQQMREKKMNLLKLRADNRC
jgi:hypothetical protein